MRHILLSASLLALLHTPSVWAQTNTDDEIISVGSRISGLSIDSTTSAATILNETEIQARGQAFLSDILRSLPGLAVSRSGSSGSLTQIRVRGNEANQVLVLIDGVEAANPTNGEFDFAGIRSEDIVKIEVLRGEQSAIWGSDAIGGVINIITRTGSTRQSTQASIEIGTDNTFEGQLSTVIPLGTAALSLNGNIFTTDGFDISGLGGEEDSSESESITLGLNNVELGALTLSALYSASELRTDSDSDNDGVFSFADPNFPNGIFISDGVLNNTNDGVITNSQRANLTTQFTAANIKNKISLSLAETDITFLSDFPDFITEALRLQANWAAEASFADAHTITILTEVEDEALEQEAFENTTNNITNFAIAGDYRFAQGPFGLTGSIRQDFNSRFDNALTGRVGASYKIEAIDGRIYGSYGTGVKNPTLNEIFGFFPGSFIGNPDIQPETSEGFNIGYRQDLNDETGFISVDYFQSDVEDAIVGTGSSVANSLTDSSREGIEVEAGWSPLTQLDLGGALTFLDAETGGVNEIRRPDFTARANFTWRPTQALSITGTLDYTGDQTDTIFATVLNDDGTVAVLTDVNNNVILNGFGGATALSNETTELDAFTLIGANISYDLNEVFSVYVRGENLSGEDYQEIVGFEAPGRKIFGGIRTSF